MSRGMVALSTNVSVDPKARRGFSKATLKKCKYDDLLRLAKFMGLPVGDCPSPGYLAAAISQAMVK